MSSGRAGLVGNYQLGRQLGSDSSGTVYSAEDLRTGATVSVKELAPELVAHPRYLDGFRAEIGVLMRLDHPNCGKVVDFLEIAGHVYVVSEPIEGQTLRQILGSTELRPGQALALLRGTLVGLGAAHAVGILHRSLRPESVLLQPDGLVKLTGFDQPAYLGGAGAALAPAAAISPYAYIAPEQVVGSPADARTDVYLAGVLGFELLSGGPPFASADPSELMSMHVGQDPPELTQLRPEITAPAADLVSRALAKSADDRQQSAREFIAQIDALTESLGVEWTEAMLVSGLAAVGALAPAIAGAVQGHAAAAGSARPGRRPRRALVPGAAALALALSGAAYGYSQRWLGEGGGTTPGRSSSSTAHGAKHGTGPGGTHKPGSPPALALVPPGSSPPAPAGVPPPLSQRNRACRQESLRCFTHAWSPGQRGRS